MARSTVDGVTVDAVESIQASGRFVLKVTTSVVCPMPSSSTAKDVGLWPSACAYVGLERTAQRYAEPSTRMRRLPFFVIAMKDLTPRSAAKLERSGNFVRQQRFVRSFFIGLGNIF